MKINSAVATVEIPIKDALAFFPYVKGVVYELINYEEGDDYRYVTPTTTGDYWICDCLPCDYYGNSIKGYEFPVPIKVSWLGEIVNLE